MLRDCTKVVLLGLASILVFPELVSYWVRARLLGCDRALEGSSQLLALVPGIVGQYVRRAFLLRTLKYCHRTVTVECGVFFTKAGACLEENVYIGPRCQLGLVHIEREVLLAAGVHVPSGAHTHGFGDDVLPIREQPRNAQQVRIGTGSWIGSAAVILADVGRNVVVGAGAVVTKPLADWSVAGGVPARVIRNRKEVVLKDKVANPESDGCACQNS